MTEKAFMGKSRARVWTYTFIAVGLLVGALVVNQVFTNTAEAKEGVTTILGLPGWALALDAVVVGAAIYALGLKVETDWPEFVGASLITGSLYAMEVVIGWQKFEMGLLVLPFVLPLVVFVLLLMIGMRKSA